ncbi:MAG: hypothetical protein ACREN5_06000 [Gemmatimonadales bacterium]
MGKINWNRVLLGGLLAGVVLNVVDYVVYGVVLAEDLNAALVALGKSGMDMSQIWWFVLLDFVYGIFLIWLYAAIRPRFGPGPRTAVIAGLAFWVLAGLLHALAEAPMGLLPVRIMVIGTAVALVVLPLAAVAGAKIYQEM